MKQLISVIQNLGQNEDKYISDNELEIIRDHKVEAAAYFHDVLDQMCSQSKEDTLNDGQLLDDGFFALFFLAEWKDTSAFAKACEILRIMGEDADGWLGDALTENLPHVLYQLFDGDYQLLTSHLYDVQNNLWVRVSYVMIAIQKYLDKSIPLSQLLSMVSRFEAMPEDELNAYILSFICCYMMHAHVEEYLPVVRMWLQRDLIDTSIVGYYADHLDTLYDYNDDTIIRTDYSLENEAGYWYKFQTSHKKPLNESISKSDWNRIMEKAQKMHDDPYKGVGRNDPCPCGSGKKFKKCCLPILEKARIGEIEPAEKRLKKAKYYPKLSFDPVSGLSTGSFEKIPGRLYLEDRYDKEAITIDYYAYLGKATLNRKDFGEVFSGRQVQERLHTERRQIADAYYEKARNLRKMRMEREGIKDLADFDRKYAIHFLSDEF